MREALVERVFGVLPLEEASLRLRLYLGLSSLMTGFCAIPFSRSLLLMN